METGNRTEKSPNGLTAPTRIAVLMMVALTAGGCATGDEKASSGSVQKENPCPVPLSRAIEEDAPRAGFGSEQKNTPARPRRYRRDPVAVWSDLEKGRIHALAGAEGFRICRRYTGCRGRNSQDRELMRILAGQEHDPKGSAPSFRIGK
ncbi:MAG: hypothetical protein IJ523_10125 [Succinivibrionaceae bacterium]|nr:hypothetical protein [Succinivibrionaceae bacterium]